MGLEASALLVVPAISAGKSVKITLVGKTGYASVSNTFTITPVVVTEGPK